MDTPKQIWVLSENFIQILLASSNFLKGKLSKLHHKQDDTSRIDIGLHRVFSTFIYKLRSSIVFSSTDPGLAIEFFDFA